MGVDLDGLIREAADPEAVAPDGYDKGMGVFLVVQGAGEQGFGKALDRGDGRLDLVGRRGLLLARRRHQALMGVPHHGHMPNPLK